MPINIYELIVIDWSIVQVLQSSGITGMVAPLKTTLVRFLSDGTHEDIVEP